MVNTRFNFQSFYFHNKGGLFKTVILLYLLLFCFFNLCAQEDSNIILKGAIGIQRKPADVGINESGLLLSLETKLKTSKNTFIGLRIQATENFNANEKYKPQQFFIKNNIKVNFNGATSGTQISFVPTFDYYTYKNSFNLYLGGGIGYYILSPLEMFQTVIPIPGFLEKSVDNQIGFLIRGGLEMGKFSVGLEYNFVVEGDIKIPNGLVIGTVNDSYFALTIGYSIRFRKER